MGHAAEPSRPIWQNSAKLMSTYLTHVSPSRPSPPAQEEALRLLLQEYFVTATDTVYAFILPAPIPPLPLNASILLKHARPKRQFEC